MMKNFLVSFSFIDDNITESDSHRIEYFKPQAGSLPQLCLGRMLNKII